MKTKRNCPHCGHALLAKQLDGEVTLWCGYGPCDSAAANHGGRGPSENIAFERLGKAVELEDELKD
jgi:ssDNA-binding Zn-finger/Zn-ribbon topoisomerase 1